MLVAILETLLTGWLLFVGFELLLIALIIILTESNHD